jgi:hypothetical protein
MTSRINKIAREAHGVYRVALESTTGCAIGEFVFTVRLDDLEVVTWDKEFDTYIGPHPWPLTTLFNAIVAFHRAQEFALPHTQ